MKLYSIQYKKQKMLFTSKELEELKIELKDLNV
jgi:hypothetical protein